MCLSHAGDDTVKMMGFHVEKPSKGGKQVYKIKNETGWDYLTYTRGFNQGLFQARPKRQAPREDLLVAGPRRN